MAHPSLEKVEVRSFGWLVSDLLSWLSHCSYQQPRTTVDLDCLEVLSRVATKCKCEDLEAVPTFKDALAELESLDE